MRKISRNSILLLVLSFLLLFPSVKVEAVMGNVTTLIYSDDYFSGDKAVVSDYYEHFVSAGLSCRLTSRPTSVYAMQQEFKNSESVYISCHGTEIGSEIVLDSGITFYATDVPANMRCKLAYLSVCCGGKTSVATGYSLCNNLIKNGYSVVVGYKTSVRVAYSRIYEKAFMNRLREGDTVREACDHVKKFMRQYHADMFDDIVLSVIVYGNADTDIL